MILSPSVFTSLSVRSPVCLCVCLSISVCSQSDNWLLANEETQDYVSSLKLTINFLIFSTEEDVDLYPDLERSMTYEGSGYDAEYDGDVDNESDGDLETESDEDLDSNSSETSEDDDEWKEWSEGSEDYDYMEHDMDFQPDTCTSFQ